MSNTAQAKAAFISALFPVDDEWRDESTTTSAFAVLDGASIEGLTGTLTRLGAQHKCLFAGQLQPDIARVSPHVVALERDSACLAWWLDEGWNRHWGVGVRAAPRQSFDRVRRHLRNLSRVRGPDGDYQLFRFYDPRALPGVLAAMGTELAPKLFGEVVQAYLCEAPPHGACRFQAGGDGVLRDALS